MTTSIDQLISDARTYASNTQSAAQIALVNAGGYADRIANPLQVLATAPPTIAVPAPPTLDSIPEFADVLINIPTAPDGVGQLLSVPVPDLGTVPANTLVAPAYVDPMQPSQFQTKSFVAPTITTDYVFPDPPAALSISLIPPTLGTHVAPTAPQINLPTFSATTPTDDITAPKDLPAQFAAAYSQQAPAMFAALNGQVDTFMNRFDPGYASNLAALEGRLAKYLAGGTALAPGIEDAIVERTRGKVDAEYRRTRDTAYTDAAKRGFSLPNGALLSAVQQARQDGADNTSRAAVELAVKQAELEQTNMQFAVTTSTQLRLAVMTASISYHSNLIQLNGQALDYAKAVLGAAISVYETMVKAYTAKLDGYRAEVAVYESRVRGVLAVIEVYKAQIQGLEAEIRVDEAQANLFRIRVESLNALVNVYRGQIDAIGSKVAVEKLKIELYGEQVRSYAVEAQAKQSEWQGYSAAVGGQEARQRAFGEQVSAYRSTIEAYRASIDAKRIGVEAATSYNEGQVRQYIGRVEGYKALISAEATLASTKVDVQRTKLSAVTAKYGAQEWLARMAQQYYATTATLGSERYRADVQFALGKAELYVKQIGTVAQVATDGARVYEGLAAAALSGMNTIVSSAITS